MSDPAFRDKTARTGVTVSHDDTVRHNARLHRAQAMFERVFRAMPVRSRLRTGSFMAIKTVAAAIVAYVIGEAIHTGQAFWAAISAIAVIQPHFGETRGATVDRILGTILGGVAGLLGLWVGGGDGDILSLGVALGAVTLACWLANAGAAARVGGITAAILLLAPNEGPLWETALYRLGEVMLGAVCALAIGWTVGLWDERTERAAKKEDNDGPHATS